jgi:hypothetical protein
VILLSLYPGGLLEDLAGGSSFLASSVPTGEDSFVSLALVVAAVDDFAAFY